MWAQTLVPVLNQLTLYSKWLILTAVLLSEATYTPVFYPHMTIMTFTTYAAIFKQLLQEQYVLSLDKSYFLESWSKNSQLW